MMVRQRRPTRPALLCSLALVGILQGSPGDARSAPSGGTCPRTATYVTVLHRQTIPPLAMGLPLIDAARGHVVVAENEALLSPNKPRSYLLVFDACSGLPLHRTRIGSAFAYGLGAADPTRGRLFAVGPASPNPGAPTDLLTLDAATGRLLQRIPFPRSARRAYVPSTVAVDARAGRVYVGSDCAQLPSGITGQCPALLSVYDERTGRLSRVTGLDSLAGSIAVDAATDRVFVGSLPTLYMLDARTGAVLRRTKVFNLGGLAVDPVTGRLYVHGGVGQTYTSTLFPIGVLDGRTGRLLYQLQGGDYLVFNRSLGRVVVSCTPDIVSPICQYDLRDGHLVQKSDSPAHFAVHAVDAADGLLLGVLRLTGLMGVLDARTGAVLQTVPVSQPPGPRTTGVAFDNVAFDDRTGRAFVLDVPQVEDPRNTQADVLAALEIPRHPAP